MTATWFGDRAVRVDVPVGWTPAALVTALSPALPHLTIRAGLASVLVESADPDPGLLDSVHGALKRRGGAPDPGGRAAGDARTVTIRVEYSGVDLAEVARMLDGSIADVVTAHQRQPWTVALMGFAPGFGYLTPLGPAEAPWSLIPRLDTPRARVPAGSVALAAGMSAVYPADMPGGWQLIGRTTSRLFDAAAQDPTLLHPGDTVRFISADAS